MVKRPKSRMPEPNQHPLLAPRMLASVGLAGLSALGIGLMLANFIVLGSGISALAALLTLSLYWRDFLRFKAWARTETTVGFLIIAIDALVPIYVFIEQPVETSQLTVSKMEMFPTAAGDSDYINVTMINTGKIAAIGPAHGSTWVPFRGELNRVQLDQFVAQLTHEVDEFRKDKPSSSETAPQEGFYFSAIIPVTRDALRDALAHGITYYLFSITEYSDANTTTNKPRVTETCNYFIPSGALYRCPFHNGFRLHR